MNQIPNIEEWKKLARERLEEKFRISVIYTVMNLWAIFWFVIGLIIGLWI